MWSSSFYLGNFIGPTVAGFLVEAYGFQWATVFFFGAYVFISIVDICELTYKIKMGMDSLSYTNDLKNDNHDDEELHLLESNK